MSGETMTTRAEQALLELLSKKPFQAVAMGEIAAGAEVSLADLRRVYDGPLDILSGFARRIDVEVLEGIDPAMAGEPAKDRLFDVLMRRFDLLSPHRAGIRGLERSARRDPVLALHLARLVVGSQTWILEAAGLSAAGPKGAAKAVALAAALTRVAPIFLGEDEAGLPKTMAALDAALDRLGQFAARVGKVERAAARVVGWCRRSREAPATPIEEAIDPSI